MTTSLITKTYNNVAFTFRPDGWFNMTKAAAHFGKRVDNFFANAETLEYINAASQIPGMSGVWLEKKRGNGGGTFAHPKLAVFFARWLDVRFSVWCDAMIEDILRGNAEVVITKPEQSAVMALPQDFASALRALADGYERQQIAEAEAKRVTVVAAGLTLRNKELVAKSLVLNKQVKALEHEVTHFTIHEFCTKAGWYFTPQEKSKLTYHAKNYCEAHDMPITTREMQIKTVAWSGSKPVNVYPLESLEYAQAQLKGYGV